MTVDRVRPETARIVEKSTRWIGAALWCRAKSRPTPHGVGKIPGTPPGVVWWRKERKAKVGFGGQPPVMMRQTPARSSQSTVGFVAFNQPLKEFCRWRPGGE